MSHWTLSIRPQLSLPVFPQQQHVKLNMAYTISRVNTQPRKSFAITHPTHSKASSLFPQTLVSHALHLACFVFPRLPEKFNLPPLWLTVAIFSTMNALEGWTQIQPVVQPRRLLGATGMWRMLRSGPSRCWISKIWMIPSGSSPARKPCIREVECWIELCGTLKVH